MKKNKKNIVVSPENPDDENNKNSVFDFAKMKTAFHNKISTETMMVIIEKTGELAAEGNLRGVDLVWRMYEFFSQPNASLEKNDRRDEWNDDVNRLIFPQTNQEASSKKGKKKKSV